MQFIKATKKKSKLRIAIAGVSGAGKSMTGLMWAGTLAEATGAKIAAIDSERGSLSLYAEQPLADGRVVDFDVIELPEHSPATYTKAIKAAAAGYGVLLIDSFSHAWAGIGGALEKHDDVVKKQERDGKRTNPWTAWRDVTPEHDRLVEAILTFPGHVICTMRQKQKHVQEGSTVKKVGMESVQRDGVEYEFTVVVDIDREHNLIVSKTRCSLLDGVVCKKPDGEFLRPVLKWLDSGADAGPPSPPPPPPAGDDVDPEEIARIKAARAGVIEQAKRLGWVGADGKVDAKVVESNVRGVSGGLVPSTSIGWEDALACFKEMSPAPVAAAKLGVDESSGPVGAALAGAADAHTKAA